MAEYLGVSRSTISNWINGRVVPSRQSLRLWALRTGAPFMWLETGYVENDETPSPDGEGVSSNVVHPPGLEPGTH